MRRLLGIFVALVVAFSIAAIPAVSAQDQGTSTIVILSSDNEADMTLAQKIAEILNATLVTTPWGVYNETVLDEIVNLTPDLVIIIGGPIAVPPIYEEALKDFNVTVLRAGGVDRAETCKKAFEIIRERFPRAFENVTVVVVYGWDYPALMEALKERGIVPLIIKNTTIEDLRKFRKIKIIRSRYAERVMRELKKKLGNNTKEVTVNVTAEIAKRAIKLAEDRLKVAKEVAKNSSKPNVDVLLVNAERDLELAKKAYEEGKYGRAFGLATAARNISEAIIKSATENSQKKLNIGVIRLKIEIRVLERVLNKLKERGVDVSIEEGLLLQAKSALSKGDFRLAKTLIVLIHRELWRDIRELHKAKHKTRG
ncbi:cell wall-binding repeat-containing protein [Pyrococcus horikoshii]|uniref:Cell wall-binding repeat 2 family protein n=2 Tax=Pyrococcus horikoshii TaxID=53953 RepID=O59327_PYRHO|nr:cell wall-binding repeat-containing protein [Pyrococcus horikoshii]BAA30786.1 367aa long hypothetical protein [Pyrococcus horikoshii OT3]HII60643.1 cell wall-binding repeat-containing protein [Pyrococcus horikoshii]